MKHTLLSRDLFREQVLLRSNYKCVFCDLPAVDAHHILERRLWPDGGYYLNNGAAVCETHHIQCEETSISAEDVRIACGITSKIIPPHLYDDLEYDKWGNVVLTSGQRLKGELFFDESVQKILKSGNVLSLFSDQVKYPRTHHVPWSESIHCDDRVISSLDKFIGQRVIVTEKMDGENTSMYNNYYHARSIDGRSHISRNWAKQFWSTISADIPQGWRVCGENLYAKHSIHYTSLPTYFMGFSIWDNKNICLPWDETLEWFELLGITPVPVLYDGIFDQYTIKQLWTDSNWAESEGYVIRLASKISYYDFKYCIAKFVRRNHVQTVKHWMHGQPVEKNILNK